MEGTVETEWPVPDYSVMHNHEVPQSWIGKGRHVQALLRICRYDLKHAAKTPEELAHFFHGTWRDDNGMTIGPMTAAHIQIIVDRNKSHFAYVKVTRMMPDNSESIALCVSATMKANRRHPTYTKSGFPLEGTGGQVDERHTVDTRGHERGRIQNDFPQVRAPEPLPQAPDVVTPHVLPLLPCEGLIMHAMVFFVSAAFMLKVI